jgi:DNA ligase-1
MQPVFEILKQLELTSGKNDKLAILQANKNNEELQRVLKYAIDPFIKFHIAKMPEPISNQSPLTSTATLDDFFNVLCKSLIERSKTGHDARDAVSSFLDGCSDQDREWYKRILSKNLRIGVDTSPDKVWPDLIGSFEVQRAEAYSPKKPKTLDRVNKVIGRGGIYSSPKMDGMRAVSWDKQLWSRGGHDIPTVPHIVATIDKYFENKYVFDGELWFPGDTKFEDFISIVKRSNPSVDSNSVIFNVFDVMYKEEWDLQQCDRILSERLKMLNDTIGTLNHPHLVVVDHQLLNSFELVTSKYNEHLEMGFEGSMLKDPNGRYVFKKSWDWIKIKPEEDEEFKCVGIQEGRDGTNFISMVGSLVLQHPNGEQFNCGSGLSLAKRKEFWNDPTKVIGKLITVKFQEKYQSGIPRFPIYKATRDYE